MNDTRSPHRKRLRRLELQGNARFLTFSCYHRLPLLSNNNIKDALVNQIARVQSRGAFALHAWVIMPDHVHLLLTPALPEWTIPQILSAIKRPFARLVIQRWREIDATVLQRIRSTNGTHHFWQRGGGYDRNITTPDEWLEKVEYIHANPVHRGIAESPTQWPWSSARWYAGDGNGTLAISGRK